MVLYIQVVGTIFTHHQKCVIVDTQASGNNRKITAFLGGIDLCDGRYDTPQHRLFRDLNTVFKDDYHNPTFPVSCWPNGFVSAIVTCHIYFYLDII
jgi:phospholipase D1/2